MIAQLMDFLLDSDVINFLVGAQMNKAHYDPNLPIEIEISGNSSTIPFLFDTSIYPLSISSSFKYFRISLSNSAIML